MQTLSITSASLPWLTIMVALPAVVGLLVLLAAPLRVIGRWVGLPVAIIELVIAIAAAVNMDWSASGYQLAETYPWITSLGISWAMGATQLSMVMILLSTALVPLVIISGWKDDDGKRDAGRNSGTYVALVLILEAFMVLIFGARDVAVFYIAFEAMLIPLYFMIGRFGDGENRRRAAMKFLLYSLFGGLVMLGGVVALFAITGGGKGAFLVENLAGYDLPHAWQLGIFITFFIAFAIKAPMVPLHTWLPDTAAAARPGTSVLLVGVLDKIGTYGMIALCLPLFPRASAQAAPIIIVFALISIIYGGLAAVGQRDLMRLVSFTSVSHFGFMVLGIYIGSHAALVGAMFYMVAHGVSIAAMFLISGYLTQRGGSREIAHYQGMQRVTPLIAGTWLVAGLASVALPGLSGFVPEYLVLMGTWSVKPAAAIVAVFGVVIAACYLLLPYKRMFTGPVPADAQRWHDLNGREKGVVTVLLAATAVLGIWAAPLINALNPVAATSLQSLKAGASASAAAPEGSGLQLLAFDSDQSASTVQPQAADLNPEGSTK